MCFNRFRPSHLLCTCNSFEPIQKVRYVQGAFEALSIQNSQSAYVQLGCNEPSSPGMFWNRCECISQVKTVQKNSHKLYQNYYYCSSRIKVLSSKQICRTACLEDGLVRVSRNILMQYFAKKNFQRLYYLCTLSCIHILFISYSMIREFSVFSVQEK